MKLLRITEAYPQYLQHYFSRLEISSKNSFDLTEKKFYGDFFGWANSWTPALNSIGYEVREITWNASPLQKLWAHEHGFNETDLRDVCVAQVKAFAPDVLWFDSTDEVLLQKTISQCPSISLKMGWVGSAFPTSIKYFGNLDCILSCASESVEKIAATGLKSFQLHHGFDQRILTRLNENQDKDIYLSFIGSLILKKEFHSFRFDLLHTLIENTPIAIYSPNGALSPLKEDLKYLAKLGRYHVSRKILKRKLEYPIHKLPRRIRGKLNPPVFGLEMYKILSRSQANLNIHADSSPKAASNMRLFETTGVGTCMLTDWKENITELFAPDREIVTYKSVEECLEKAAYLISNPQKCREIGLAGQKRTLEQHTFHHRAKDLNNIIVKLLK